MPSNSSLKKYLLLLTNANKRKIVFSLLLSSLCVNPAYADPLEDFFLYSTLWPENIIPVIPSESNVIHSFLERLQSNPFDCKPYFLAHEDEITEKTDFIFYNYVKSVISILTNDDNTKETIEHTTSLCHQVNNNYCQYVNYLYKSYNYRFHESEIKLDVIINSLNSFPRNSFIKNTFLLTSLSFLADLNENKLFYELSRHLDEGPTRKNLFYKIIKAKLRNSSRMEEFTAGEKKTIQASKFLDAITEKLKAEIYLRQGKHKEALFSILKSEQRFFSLFANLYSNLIDLVKAECFFQANDTSKALELLKNVIKEPPLVLSPIEKTKAMLLQGEIYIQLGKIKEAQQIFEELLVKSREMDFSYLEGRSLLGLGKINFILSEHEKAEELYGNALKISLENDFLDVQGRILCELGKLHFTLSDVKKAEELLYEALRISNKIEDNQNLANIYIYLGEIEMEKVNFSQARHFFEVAHQISDKMKNLHITARALIHLGDLERTALGNNNAKALYKQALSLLNKNDNMIYGLALFGLTVSEDHKKNLVNRFKRIEELSIIFNEQNDKNGISLVFIEKGKLLLLEGNYEEAAIFIEKALKLSEKMNNFRLKTIALRELSEVEYHKKEIEKAFRIALISLENAIRSQSVLELSNSYLLISKLYESMNDQSNAKKAHEKAISLNPNINKVTREQRIIFH